MWYIIGKIEIAGNILGYVIANPKTKQVQALPVHQVSSIINQIYNAEIKSNSIELTDGSAPRLFYFDTNLHPIQDSTPNRIFIFSEDLDRKGNTYSVFTLSGFFIITEDQLKAYDGKATLINGKFVHQGGKIIISALRGTFPKTKDIMKSTQKQKSVANPYASNKQQAKPKKQLAENPYHKQFRERLQKAILSYSAVGNAHYAMGYRNSNCLAKLYHANDIWKKAIQEPGFIYCDNILIKIAENSNSIAQFIRSANLYFVYLQKTGKKPDLPISYRKSGFSAHMPIKTIKLPPNIKADIINKATNGVTDKEILVESIYFYSNELYVHMDYTAQAMLKWAKEHNVTLRTTALTRKDLLFSCGTFLEKGPSYIYPNNMQKMRYYVCNALYNQKYMHDRTIFYLRLWYNTVRQPVPGCISPELAKIYEDLMLSYEPDNTMAEWVANYNKLTGRGISRRDLMHQIQNL